MPVGLIVALLAGIYLLSCSIFARMITHSHRQPLIFSPQEYEMAFEDIRFMSQDGLEIKGWFIPGSLNKTIILTHPFPFNRHGFLKKNQGWLRLFGTDVHLLKTAQKLNQAGYGVLMFDFRNHGESQSGITGIGLNESPDVIGAVEYLKGRMDDPEHRIGFVSFCMGANATIIALSKIKDDLAPIQCLVAVQPISALVFVRSYLKNVFTSASLILIPMVDRLTQASGGYPLADMSPLPYCKDLQVPVLFIQGKHDPWTELSDIQGFYDAAPGEKKLLWIEQKLKRFEVYNLIGEQPEEVLAFLNTHL